jgi:hydroxymethylpyrimidine/phosphomethylpyrimidine kinase
MQTERPYVLTIAGLDPSSGAGLTADIKTFEQLKVYGLAVCTGLTLQTEKDFFSVSWRSLMDVKNEVELLLQKYPVRAVKFGIVPSFRFLHELVDTIKQINPEIKIVVDPVWRASSGFELNKEIPVVNSFRHIELLTPNIPELEFISGEKNKEDFLREIIQYTNVLLKGGHSNKKTGTDILYTNRGTKEITPSQKTVFAKHGSGCVLSAAITAGIASGKSLEESCISGKKYIENFLSTNKSLMGFHAA